jgi:hypothetical protein
MESAMTFRVGFVAALVSLCSTAALAERPPIDKPVQLSLIATTTEAESCSTASSPLPVRDASDAVWFATGPTSSHDMTELHAAVIAPLVNFAVVGTNILRLYVFGAPMGTTLHFSAQQGWAPRWPFC